MKIAAYVATIGLFIGACGQAPRATVSVPVRTSRALATEYKQWLDEARTPRRAVQWIRARSTQFQVTDPITDEVTPLSPGSRLTFINRDRAALMVIVGKKSITRGVRMIGAHLDTPSPRWAGATLIPKTQATLVAHKYGGFRAGQWHHVPVALVGQVVGMGGHIRNIELGLHDDFSLFVKAEARSKLSVITSTTGTSTTTLMGELHRRYGLTASDLEAAELYIVPRERARDVGLDRALVGAHGQDDRINCYAAWRALHDITSPPQHTAVAWLVDREEVGSTGTAGAQSQFLELVFAYLLRAEGKASSEAHLHSAFANSQALSADTPAALNPNWPEVHERLHAPQLGQGPAVFPFTGSRGKQGGGAAHAELIATLRSVFAKARIPLQTAELGRVDEGGGGTIAKYLSERGIDTIDVGISVISMHSPMEISSKRDLWLGYRGFLAWLSQ